MFWYYLGQAFAVFAFSMSSTRTRHCSIPGSRSNLDPCFMQPKIAILRTRTSEILPEKESNLQCGQAFFERAHNAIVLACPENKNVCTRLKAVDSVSFP